MKKIIAILACFASFSAFAQVVNGYTRSDGTYVAPHFRSAPDGVTYNNYGNR
jgi:hypothetical protein